MTQRSWIFGGEGRGGGGSEDFFSPKFDLEYAEFSVFAYSVKSPIRMWNY